MIITVSNAKARIAELQAQIAALQADVRETQVIVGEERDAFNAKWAAATVEDRESIKAEGEAIYDAIDVWNRIDYETRVLGQN
jgi:hypothetical protein